MAVEGRANGRATKSSVISTGGEAHRAEVSYEAVHGRLPVIDVTDRAMSVVAEEAWRNLIRKAPAMNFNVFNEHGNVVEVLDQGRNTQIRLVLPSTMAGLADRTSHFKGTKGEKGGLVTVFPPTRVMQDMLDFPHRMCPQLKMLMFAPYFAASGDLVTCPGYIPQTRIWLVDDPQLESLPRIPDNPTQTDVDRARETLDDLIADFRFKSTADRVNALGYLLTYPLRPYINDNIPMTFVRANHPRVGKTLLARLGAIVATGMEPRLLTLATGDCESRRVLTLILLEGRPFATIDNVKEGGTFGSHNLAGVLTAPEWSDRICGGKKLVTVPNNVMWTATGNNIKMTDEIAQRILLIDLMKPQGEDPLVPRQFRHLELTRWVRENRVSLVQAVLTLDQNWFAQGCPPGHAYLGGFERWATTLSGVLESAGYEGFMQNQINDELDIEEHRWIMFCESAFEKFGGRPAIASEYLDKCECDLLAEIRKSDNERSRVIQLGKMLSTQVGQRFGDYIIEDAGLSQGYQRYAIRKIESESRPGDNGQVDSYPPLPPIEGNSLLTQGIVVVDNPSGVSTSDTDIHLDRSGVSVAGDPTDKVASTGETAVANGEEVTGQ